jgi:hypothetical protein
VFSSRSSSPARAVRYQCPSRDDESNDCGESEGQCGPYQEPQGFGKVPERSGTFCLRPDPNGHSFSRSGEQTLGQKATHALHTARRLIQISQNFPH